LSEFQIGLGRALRDGAAEQQHAADVAARRR